MVKTVKFQGKEYQANFNANRELSQSIEGLDDKVLLNWPRERLCNNGIPVIKDDTGTELRLGWHFMTDSEKETQKNYKKGLNTGTGTKSSGTKSSSPKIPQVPLSVIEDVLAQKGLSKETRALFEDMKKEAEEAQKAKMEKAKNLLSGFSKAELEALKAILG